MKITKDTLIAQAIAENPMLAEVLLEMGVGCSSCFMSQAETIEQGLMGHGFGNEEIEQFIKHANE